ncbi:hypothetical protein PILCRDRAFT_10966 [Piloderma croceum F 1598]|uniref:CHAT domain-containing protein n=1 Tax=Piloderma croceum (strain F 1598) TaxID=765440 RepID=A0A0C3AXL1_PILCF|nr:hypothetical protein PILCRDRAFT_10966 [Piloderma croceum F 1598]
MPNASLAFLSACETAMGNENLPDEAIHLGATLLYAGFQGVVATLWSIADVDSPKIADSFYEYLSKNMLRSENAAFVHWVPFIHLVAESYKKYMHTQLSLW